jgi:hypothetical protein
MAPEGLEALLNGRDLDSLSTDEKMALLAQAGILTSNASPSPPAGQKASAAPARPASIPTKAGPELATEEDKIAYLRARGVEVDLAEERGKPRPAPPAVSPGAGTFVFVRIPADESQAVSTERAAVGESDILKTLLAPRFASDAAMDAATVARETAGRLKNMVASGGAAGADLLKSPSADTMSAMAAGGACEAYPLTQSSAVNGWRSVRLYIDEVGALRSRPRNKRAEALAAAAGLTGLSIHGDAYVGRCERTAASGSGAEVNADFGLTEMAHDAEWVLAARREHMVAAARAGHGDTEHLAGGEHGVYSWSQTDDEVEVRVGVRYRRGEGMGGRRRGRGAITYFAAIIFLPAL